ncbi:MAG: TldD/PmbA family protein [Candidatus Caldatribacteriota bacterium]|nr:TldD/PmbA family protein [Candidatus Caldatribacteriota bacterium]
MKEILKNALTNVSKADYVEIRLEKKATTSIKFQGKKLEKINSSQEIGGNVRALVKGGWSFITFNRCDELKKKVEQAINVAALIGKSKSELVEVPPVTEVVKRKLDRDFRQVKLKEKKELMENYNNIVLNYSPKIQSTNIVYADKFSTIYFANSEGTYIRQEKPFLAASITAVAREGDNIQMANEALGTTKGFKGIEDISLKAEKAASRAVSLLKAKSVEGGEYTVVLDQTLGGVFIHEAFGHLSEADFLYEDNRMRNIMKLGTKFGFKKLNVIDDGSIPNFLGSAKYDDEGVRTKKNYLIRNGVLVGRLHSRETAKKMNETPTGNARALNYRFKPIVRMTNTYIDNGKIPFNELISGIKKGIYAKKFYGGNTTFEMFTFSAGEGFMIRDGKIAEPVKDVVLSGNLFTVLNNITAVGDDLKMIEGAGGCGKNGQAPLPVSFGSPHLRIKKVVVGGK